MNRSIITVMTGLLAAGLAGSAFAGTIPLKQEVSGNFFNTSIDTNRDGQPAIQVLAGTTGTFGPASFDGLQEGMLTAPSGSCDPGMADVGLVAGSFVQRFSNGDLLISQLVDGAGCLDPNTFAVTVTLHMAIIGGTGRFAGASGEYTLVATASPLLIDPVGPGLAHGVFTGQLTGTLATDGN